MSCYYGPLVLAAVVLLASTVCAQPTQADIDQARENQAAARREQYGLRLSEDSNSKPETWGVGTAGQDVATLWELSDDDVGKVTDVEINTVQNYVAFGTTFLPLTLVSVVDLMSGTIKAKASPQYLEQSFVFGIESSDDGKFLAVMGTPLQAPISTIWMYPNADLTAKPLWQYAFNGTVFWGSRDLKMDRAATYIVQGFIQYRPSFVGPVPGGIRWYDAKTGQLQGSKYLPATMGEVWLDDVAGARMGCRNFNDTEGNFTTLTTPKGNVLSNVLDKYNGITVSAGVTHMMTPKDTDVYTVETYNTQTGALEWYYTNPSTTEELYAIDLGLTSAVVVWWATAPQRGYQVRVFSLQQTSTQATPFASFFIAASAAGIIDGPLVSISGTADADVTLALPGMGVYYTQVSSSTPTPTPKLVYTYADTCGFATLTTARVAKGLVVIAGRNERVSSDTCQLSASLWAGLV